MHVVELVKASKVSKAFPKTGPVVENLDLVIPRGQFVCLLGPSGCGKSTLLRLIAGLDAPDSGAIEVQTASAGKVSYVFQEPHLLPWRSALENVMLPLELRGNTDKIRERAARSLSRVGLGEALEKKPHELSGGMKMRVSLARALVTDPEVLLLDEPFAALDELTRHHLQEDLLRYWQTGKMTVLFVTHSISEAAFLGQRQIVFSNRPARVMADRATGLSERSFENSQELRLSAKFQSEVRELQGLQQTFGIDRRPS